MLMLSLFPFSAAGQLDARRGVLRAKEVAGRVFSWSVFRRCYVVSWVNVLTLATASAEAYMRAGPP